MNERLVNFTFNASDVRNGTELTKIEHLIRALDYFVLPAIVIIGTLGNIMSFLTFVSKPLGLCSSSVLLALRSVSDLGFLGTVFVIWLSAVFELHLNDVKAVCQLLVFASYVCGCFSVWLVVLVTVENFLRIFKPFTVSKICTRKKAKLISGIMAIIITGIYSFPFWTIGPQCRPENSYRSFVKIMVYVDAVLTMVLPVCIIFPAMVAIILSSFGICVRRKKLSTSSLTGNRPLKKVTSMLSVVTLSCLILNLPSHIVRIYLLITTRNENRYVQTNVSLSQSISLLLYYTSFSINVVIYYAFGSRFRNAFKNLFYHRCCTKTGENRKNYIASPEDRKMSKVMFHCKTPLNQQTSCSSACYYPGSGLRYASGSDV
ncbi:hypothetical protein DPMN_136196 [Dreissena polymorpha]|uniref:G-protein coupled receptors family 1 profile domain-containing protein n=1 Tax=Dreissena polymorpha TaxID=45954 RepID=A0A9D4FZ91_DREPO|nr:hypothetical protein DPMN_136196 [Dreissena polymorpha]